MFAHFFKVQNRTAGKRLSTIFCGEGADGVCGAYLRMNLLRLITFLNVHWKALLNRFIVYAKNDSEQVQKVEKSFLSISFCAPSTSFS